MQVREVNVTDADGKSAQLFFDALTGFYDLSQARALDMFARNGQLTVSKYAGKVRSVDAWELGAEHAEALAAIDPKVIVKIGCSYLNASMFEGRYDMIVIDSPQGAHKDFSGAVRFEHFHAIQQVKKLAKDRCIVVLYVNTAPYNRDTDGDFGYDQYEEYDFDKWMGARKTFYSSNPLKISVATALWAYEREFGFVGFDVTNALTVPCYSDHPRRESYSFRVGFEIVRR
jgi:predicted RNA methylase